MPPGEEQEGTTPIVSPGVTLEEGTQTGAQSTEGVLIAGGVAGAKRITFDRGGNATTVVTGT